MSVKIDPRDLIGMAADATVQASVIIGMSSPTAQIPGFVIGVIPTEEAQASVTMASMQLTGGDLLQKVAVDSSLVSFTLILSDTDQTPAEWVDYIATGIQQISGLANSTINHGAVLPNLSSVTANFARSQLAVLMQMKNNAQPIYILNSYLSLASIQQQSPYLQSRWFIDSINILKEETAQGIIVDIVAREMLVKRDASKRPDNIIRNVASVATGGITDTIPFPDIDYDAIADSIASGLDFVNPAVGGSGGFGN